MTTINKSACRKAGGQMLQICPEHGLLHASQIHWLVTAAVKIIDHHRTLVLNVYPREQAAKGDLAPRWTVYQTKTDYVTMERKVDGSTAWRTAAFERLSGEWRFIDLCAFVSSKDEQHVTRYFRDATCNGFLCLMRRQNAIQAQRRAKREKQKQKKIRERMRGIPAIPRGLEQWVQRQAMPAYWFYDKKGRKATTGVCSACNKESQLVEVKHNKKTICPKCGREVTCKSRGRAKYLQDRDTVQLIQRIGPSELVVRIFKVYYDYFAEGSKEIREAMRQFIRVDPNGDLAYENYYASYGVWKKGQRPLYICYQYQFEADDFAYLYTGNLPTALRGTPWQYTPITEFAEHFSSERMQARPFLAADLKHPRLEHLCKVGFFDLASDLVYKGDYNHTLDENQNRTHRILGVAVEDVLFLRDLAVDMDTLQQFIKYRGLRDRQALLRWQLNHDVKYNLEEILRQITPHKLMQYLDHQQSHPDPQARERYAKMQNAVTEYRDYLDLCKKLGDDLASSFVLYPKNLREAHDNASKRLKIKVDKEMRRNFKVAYQRIMAHADFTAAGLQMVYPNTPEEIAAEGQALHHCVGGYVDRVARKECLILFLRHTDDLAKPFYTVEVRGQKAVQVRGYKNADPTPEVQTFMAAWERNVLQAA